MYGEYRALLNRQRKRSQPTKERGEKGEGREGAQSKRPQKPGKEKMWSVVPTAWKSHSGAKTCDGGGGHELPS